MSRSSSFPDHIHITNLSVHAPLGASRWPKPSAHSSAQPIIISVSVPLSLYRAGSSDSLDDSLNYSTLCKTVEKVARRQGGFACAEHLAETIAEDCFAAFRTVYQITVRVKKPHALLHADSAGVEIVRKRGEKKFGADKLFVENLSVSCIIGINAWERVDTQVVKLNLEMHCADRVNPASESEGFEFRGLVNDIQDVSCALPLSDFSKP